MLIKFNETLRNRKQAINQEQGSAFIFAVLLLMVMTLTVVLITTTTITGAQTASTLATRDLLKQAAEAGLNNALLQANQSSSTNALEVHRGIDNAANGVMSATTSTVTNSNLNLRWRWYTQQVVFPGQKTGYYVYSEGYSNTAGVDQTLTLRAQFLSVPVSAAKYNSTTNSPQYVLANSWESGLAGLSSMTVEPGVYVYTADSNYGSIPIGTSTTGTTVVSNNTVVVNTIDSGLRQVNLAHPSSTGTGCDGIGCDTLGVTYRGYTVTNEALVDVFSPTGNCPAGSYDPWIASENGGLLNLPEESCVGSLVFDVDTILPASSSKTNPLKVYSQGSVVVYKGVRVNYTNIPLALQIFSANGSLSIGDPAFPTGVDNSYAAFEFATHNGSCQVHDKATYFGVFSCANSTLGSGSVVYMDLAAREIASTNPNARNIWSLTYTEEL